jgi:hypothetical protein
MWPRTVLTVPVESVPSRILDAHGGLDYWHSLACIDIEISAYGFLFTTKRVPPQRHARLTINTRKPEVTLWDYPAPGQRATLHGTDRVEITDGGGSVLQSRTNPRAAFAGKRLLTPWDALDFAYFSGYAMWNYLTLPFLLLEPGVTVHSTDRPAAKGMTRLLVGYPPTIPTHSTDQELYFDQTGRLHRHDYTAEVVGSWATAIHLCDDYRQFGGLQMPTTRRVYPKGPFNRPLPFPTLVAVDVHDAQPRPA